MTSREKLDELLYLDILEKKRWRSRKATEWITFPYIATLSPQDQLSVECEFLKLRSLIFDFCTYFIPSRISILLTTICDCNDVHIRIKLFLVITLIY
ncbi:hypothetical protein OESDEN_21840 [Oesophagostomum dentatum]|uniref:Uncharacterized protein n=1 Tax=Oesophagostomum dentatum TaxID=61180 RepID=A0A0B1RZL1_OESDE|nr:hypothetical protein OESDEN_21840 [Oesophagostomum dentatum]